MTDTSNVTDAGLFSYKTELHAINTSIPWNYLRFRRFIEVLTIPLAAVKPAGPAPSIATFIMVVFKSDSL